MRFWKPPGFVQRLEGGGKNKTKKKKRKERSDPDSALSTNLKN